MIGAVLRKFLSIFASKPVELPSELPWTGVINGDDVVVNGVKATWFGGDNDPEDNGQTASGICTKCNPDLMGCALPVIATVKGQRYLPTCESPLAVTPKIPWNTIVEVACGSRVISVPLIDNGPNVFFFPKNAIDLTPAAFKALGGNLEDGTLTVSFRIKNVAKYFQNAS